MSVRVGHWTSEPDGNFNSTSARRPFSFPEKRAAGRITIRNIASARDSGVKASQVEGIRRDVPRGKSGRGRAGARKEKAERKTRKKILSSWPFHGGRVNSEISLPRVRDKDVGRNARTYTHTYIYTYERERGTAGGKGGRASEEDEEKVETEGEAADGVKSDESLVSNYAMLGSATPPRVIR